MQSTASKTRRRAPAKVNVRTCGAKSNGQTNAARHPADLTMRPAVPGDFEPLSFFFDTALRKDYFIRRGQLKDILSGPHHQVYVAEIDAVLVGVAITTRHCRLVNALVHPAYRGLGIGRALIEVSGTTEVRVKRDMSSGDPINFYRSLGFESTGEFNAKGNIEIVRKNGQSSKSKAVNGKEK